MGRRHFPPPAEAVLDWAAYFAAGRTPQQYLPHEEKARSPLVYGIEWKTEAAPQAARGPVRTGDRMRAVCGLAGSGTWKRRAETRSLTNSYRRRGLAGRFRYASDRNFSH